MPGKKAKASAPVSAPTSAKKGAAKASAKGSAIGSLKKILGFASPAKATQAKSAPAAKPVAAPKGAKLASTKAVPPKAAAKADKVAKPAPVAAKAGKGAAPAKPELHAKGKTEVLTKPLTKPVKAPKAPRMRETHGHGAPVCREVACELMSTTGGYCRMHYIKNWKKIKRKEMILKEKKLNHYIEELVSKYPDKYIEAIRQDLASEKDFAKVIADLEIEEGMDDFESVDTESAEGIIDNLKRDFEDDGDVF